MKTANLDSAYGFGTKEYSEIFCYKFVFSVDGFVGFYLK